MKQTCIKQGVKKLCGLTAKQILIDRIADNNVSCVNEGKDQYKRTLAECFVNNQSLSSYLVRSGYAFAYRKYSKSLLWMKIMPNLINLVCGQWNLITRGIGVKKINI